jgi:signal transduction histidine kinase
MFSHNFIPPKMGRRMNMAEILIDNRGIRRAVKKYEYTHAIAEFVWNGFDAGARTVKIDVIANEVGNISEIVISDNGEGIPFAKLESKFRPFFEVG